MNENVFKARVAIEFNWTIPKRRKIKIIIKKLQTR
jgi:hypothetical protein